jgi:hypothetical protein
MTEVLEKLIRACFYQEVQQNWSKNFSHLAYEKSEAKMFTIVVNSLNTISQLNPVFLTDRIAKQVAQYQICNAQFLERKCRTLIASESILSLVCMIIFSNGHICKNHALIH